MTNETHRLIVLAVSAVALQQGGSATSVGADLLAAVEALKDERSRLMRVMEYLDAQGDVIFTGEWSPDVVDQIKRDFAVLSGAKRHG